MSEDCLRTGDKALVHFRFIKHPEYIKPGQRMVFREGRTKAVGNVLSLFPHSAPGNTISTKANKANKMQSRQNSAPPVPVNSLLLHIPLHQMNAITTSLSFVNRCLKVQLQCKWSVRIHLKTLAQHPKKDEENEEKDLSTLRCNLFPNKTPLLQLKIVSRRRLKFISTSFWYTKANFRTISRSKVHWFFFYFGVASERVVFARLH